MSLISLFRLTLIFSPLFAVLGSVYTVIATPHFSQDWQNLLEWSGDGFTFIDLDSDKITLSMVVFLIVGLLFILTAIINQIALYFFWPPSRFIYLALTGIGFASVPFLGIFVSPPWEALLYELSIFLNGITLALAYFSPIAAKFEKEKKTEQGS